MHGHIHSLDDIAGYVVRHTIDAEGVTVRRPAGDTTIWLDAEHTRSLAVGTDVATFDGGNSYSRALDAAKAIRALGKAWAVVDPFYADGCRGIG